jgi:hypothetical protein
VSPAVLPSPAMSPPRARYLTPLALLAPLALAAPADMLPAPAPEPCKAFNADPAEGEIAFPDGLDYDQVTTALNGVLQTALYCGQPEGMSSVHLTFELMVGCDGVISTLETVEDGGAPAEYVGCVAAVIRKADFPAHDLPDGQAVTYPVNVSW